MRRLVVSILVGSWLAMLSPSLPFLTPAQGAPSLPGIRATLGRPLSSMQALRRLAPFPAENLRLVDVNDSLRGQDYRTVYRTMMAKANGIAALQRRLRRVEVESKACPGAAERCVLSLAAFLARTGVAIQDVLAASVDGVQMSIYFLPSPFIEVVKRVRSADGRSAWLAVFGSGFTPYSTLAVSIPAEHRRQSAQTGEYGAFSARFQVQCAGQPTLRLTASGGGRTAITQIPPPCYIPHQ